MQSIKYKKYRIIVFRVLKLKKIKYVFIGLEFETLDDNILVFN